MRRIKCFSVLVVVILVDEHAAETNVESAVYVANDIVYYEEGKDIS